MLKQAQFLVLKIKNFVLLFSHPWRRVCLDVNIVSLKIFEMIVNTAVSNVDIVENSNRVQTCNSAIT